MKYLLLTAIMFTSFHAFALKLYTKDAYSTPWFWNNYGGSVEEISFVNTPYIMWGHSSKEFVADIIKVNIDKSKQEMTKVKIKNGYLNYIQDYFYYTTDFNGDLISVFVEGEEEGILPNYGYDWRWQGDDHLCFFKGIYAGKCASGDDT